MFNYGDCVEAAHYPVPTETKLSALLRNTAEIEAAQIRDHYQIVTVLHSERDWLRDATIAWLERMGL